MIAVTYLVALLGGAAAALSMNLLMKRIGKAWGEDINMVIALGSFFSGRMDNASHLGTLIHAAAGTFFGLVYALAFDAIGYLTLPGTFLLGLGIGLLHGVLVSYALMISVGERHPIEKYRRVTLQVGVLHLLGHVYFGGVVGLLVGLAGSLASPAPA